MRDFFNDKIDFTCIAFDDVCRLNEKLLDVATKFDLFGETDRARQELEKFKLNFEVRVCDWKTNTTAKIIFFASRIDTPNCRW